MAMNTAIILRSSASPAFIKLLPGYDFVIFYLKAL